MERRQERWASSFGRSPLLIVDDDAHVRNCYERLLRRFRPIVDAPSAALALDLAATQELAGAIIDVGLADGNGLDVAARLRERRPELPTLIVTGNEDPAVCRWALRLGVFFGIKPIGLAEFAPLLAAAATYDYSFEPKLYETVQAVAEKRGLTLRDRELLVLLVRGIRRPALAGALHISEEGLKSAARRLLGSFPECENLQEIANLVYRDAMGGARG